tara:strand:- start:68 stop:1798 length:1731 start_codon:yes stop_codon:yes gene_type:complete
MVKLLSFSDESRGALEKGVNALADALKVTIGPKGRNVVIEKKFGAPDIVNDGVTIAREIELDDPFENLGAKLIEQVASKTKDKAGDGTTTATVLAQVMVHEGLRNTAAGASPIELRKGMGIALNKVIEELAKQSKEVSGDSIQQVATVSAGGDEEIGKMVAEAMKKVSVDGVISVEESNSLATELEITEGMAFDRGYSSPYFVTDPERQICEFENPLLLITDRKISSINELVPVLETVQKTGTPLVILSEETDGEALATLVVNKNRGVLQVAAVRAPSFGERRKAALADIAILTGATLISEDKAMTVDKVQLSDLGKARRITITKEKTTIIANENHKKEVSERVEAIKRELRETDSDYDRDKLNDRIAKLAGGVAVIKVGAPTETELKNRKLRIEDALNATRAAVEEGIVAGGGATLLQLSNSLIDLSNHLTGDQKTGAQIVQKALSAPAKQIAINAGKDGDVVVSEMQRLQKGFNALTDTYEDLLKIGIVDAAKVLRLALQDAVSIASMLITTEVVIADKPEPPLQPGAEGGGDPMGGMGGMGGMGMPGMGGMGMPGMGGMGMPGMGGMGMPGMM